MEKKGLDNVVLPSLKFLLDGFSPGSALAACWQTLSEKAQWQVLTPNEVSMHLLEVRAGTSWILVTDNIKEKPALTSSVLPWFELISNLRF